MRDEVKPDRDREPDLLITSVKLSLSESLNGRNYLHAQIVKRKRRLLSKHGTVKSDPIVTRICLGLNAPGFYLPLKASSVFISSLLLV